MTTTEGAIPKGQYVQYDPGEAAFFDSLHRFSEPLSISSHKNVYVTRSGVCLKRCRILPDSIHGYTHRHSILKLVTYGSMASRPAVRLADDTEYLIIHNLWSGGYYHWVTESLVRLVEASEYLDRAAVLLPSSTALTAIMADSSRAMGATRIEWFPTRTNVIAPRLILPRNPPFMGNYEDRQINEVRHRALTAAPGFPEQPVRRRLYISRAKSRARKIINEEDVISLLNTHGFSVIYPEKLSFLQQVATFRNAAIIVGIHGAGLTNALFMPRGGKILEIIRRPATTRSDWNRVLRTSKLQTAYAKLAMSVHLEYRCLLATPESADQRFDEANIIVDLRSLDRKLQELL